MKSGYDFFVPAPPRPAASSQLVYREIPRVNGSAATEQVTETPNGLLVHVTFPDKAGGLAYGTTFLVGWTNPAQPPATHLRLNTTRPAILHQGHPSAAP